MRKNPVKPTSRVYEGGLNRLKPGGFFWVGFYPNNPAPVTGGVFSADLKTGVKTERVDADQGRIFSLDVTSDGDLLTGHADGSLR